MDDKTLLEEIQSQPVEIRVALFASLFYMVDKTNASLPITFETIQMAARICDIDVELGAKMIADESYKTLIDGMNIPPDTQKLMSLAALSLFPMDIESESDDE